MTVLDQHHISRHLHELLDAVPVLDVFPCVTSTNTLCAEKALQADFGQAYVCIAEQQTQGRGRRGRVWDSPPSAGLYLSIAWRIADIEAWQGLSLAVGLVMVQALEKVLHARGLQLKWPNDILYDNKKLGGVLIEIVRDAAGAPVLVIGAGINCQRDTPSSMVSANERAYLSDVEPSMRVSRSELAAVLVAAIIALLQEYDVKQFAAYRADWEHYDAYRGCDVLLLSADRVAVSGVASGINSSGELLVMQDGVVRTVNAGELSLRLAT